MTYACHNKPIPADRTYPAQDGWFYDESGMTRKPVIVQQKSAFDLSVCAYARDLTKVDPKCAGCVRDKRSEA